jgi:hypothetical protein
MKLVSLKSVFQYESNNTNNIKYNQDFIAQFVWSKLTLKNA